MLSALATAGIAAQLAIIAHAPDTVNSCQAVDITVAVSATGGGVRVVPQITAPSFHPFDLLRRSARPYVQYGPGSRITAEYRYTVAIGGVGRFTIPPFEARIGSERVVSAPLTLTVRQSRGRGAPAVVARARIDTSASPEILEVAGTRTDTVYVGQQATYEVAVFLNGPLRERLRHNPTFYPPEMQAMLAYDLPVTPTARRVGSQCFDALVYRRALFPLAAGRLTIPPAQLVYRTSLSPYMYRAEESHELSTDSVMLVAVEPPDAGRPAEYNGAVGDLRVDATIDTVAPRVGDPMLFTVRVTGSGNVKLFPRPIVRVPWAGLVAADERVSVDSGSARVAGAKEFDWVLTPRVAGEFDLPPVRYGYFDPAKRRYDIAVAPGSRLRILDGALASADTGDVRPVLGIRATYRGPASTPIHSRGAFWLAMALVPLPALVTRARRRPPRVARAEENPMRALIAASSTDDPVVLRRHYVRSLARRLGCNPEDFTHPGALERALRRAGVSDDTSARAEALLRELDSAAYDRETHIPRGAGRRAASIARAVDAEALSRAELPFWLPLIVAAASLALAAGAIAADTASTHFSRGVSSYLRDDYQAARDAFGHAVTMQPASADAWANYGTASFTLNDTAAAVLGWRQALAIEPGSRDLHERMSLVRIEGPGAPGWVPALPRNITVWFFAVLWVAAWALAWGGGVRDARWRARIAWADRLPIPLAAVALVIGLLAIEVETRISGSRLAVVRQPIALSSDPALGLDRGPALGTGEIVAVQARRGGWTRVSATAEREGWVATSSLHLMDERRVPRD